eukprot:SAG11_NODE_2490_length_3294_cov_3.906416_2_plen_183_part_00
MNPACIATGNAKHANIHAVFLVSQTALVHALCNLPRYLGVTADLVRADLQANETSTELRTLMEGHAVKEGKPKADGGGLLAVVAAWKAPTFVESPVLYTKPDGTEVTNWQDSLAKWAGTTDAIRGSPKWQAAVTKAVRAQEARYAAAQETLRVRGGEDEVVPYGVADNETVRLGKMLHRLKE